MLRFVTHLSNLGGSPGRPAYYASLRIPGTKGIRATAAELVELGSAVNAPTIEYVLRMFAAYLPRLIASDGCRRQLGDLATFYPALSGRFDAPDEPFDPARHRLSIGVRPRRSLAAGIAGAEIVNVTRAEPRPRLGAVFAQGAEAPRNVVLRGLGVVIQGRDLAPDPSRPDEGATLAARALTARLAVEKSLPGEVVLAADGLAALPDGRCVLTLATRAGRGPEAPLYTLTRRVTLRRAAP